MTCSPIVGVDCVSFICGAIVEFDWPVRVRSVSCASLACILARQEIHTDDTQAY